ncbi:MAG: hypothetical protein LBP25_03330, partial [Tannerellaceae bacterium]|nr:hypothetical protein [Tannerellaceae bacterium]
KEDELKDLKTELAALNRKIELSLKPLDSGEDKEEEEKAIQEIQALFTGKKLPGNITDRHGNDTATQSFPVPERLKEYKEAMGDRLVTGSVPKHENQSKGFRL